MARLRERSKMDWNALTTVNQQKNKCSALLVCWIPHGRLWAVHLVWTKVTRQGTWCKDLIDLKLTLVVEPWRGLIKVACDCLLPLSNDCRHNHMLPLCYKMHEGGGLQRILESCETKHICGVPVFWFSFDCSWRHVGFPVPLNTFIVEQIQREFFRIPLPQLVVQEQEATICPGESEMSGNWSFGPDGGTSSQHQTVSRSQYMTIHEDSWEND